MDEPPFRGGKQEGSEDEDDRPEEFPQGIEGTRGPKDSAWRARQWFRDQRGMDEVGTPETEHPGAGADRESEDQEQQSEREEEV